MIELKHLNKDTDKPGLVITIDNGDLEALTETLSKWKFKDEASLLRFMFAVMARSTDNTIYINDGSPKHSAYAPADSLLNTSQDQKQNGTSK